MNVKLRHLPVILIALNSKETLASLEFDLSSLELTDKQASELDKDMLKHVDIDIPGNYLVDINVNGNKALSTSITFKNCDKKLCPEVTKSLLSSLGVNVGYFKESAGLADDEIFLLPSKHFPDIRADFQKNKLQLNLSIPQAAILNSARGYIPVIEWDDGIPVIFAALNGTGDYSNAGNESTRSSNYLNINSGANLGPWRLRNQGYYQDSNGAKEWKSIQTYLSRDIKMLRSQFYAGQYSTSGKTLPGFSFKGAMLSSDLNMLPDSLRGFAPVIRGIALSQAKIEVRQKGNVIYQTFVPPGAFEITDLYPTSGGGDLEVTVEEADGTQRKFTQAYASSTVMLRHNQFEYALAAGRYDSSQSRSRNDKFVQVEALYGVLDSTTVYAGLLSSTDYRNTLMGIAQGLGILGSLSFDIQQAESKNNQQEKLKGKAWQVKYSKIFPQTNTTLSASHLRYLDEGFKTFDQFESQNISRDDKTTSQSSDIRSRQQLTLSQSFSRYGSLSASIFKQQGFYQKNTSHSYNVSYSFNVRGVSTSLAWSSSSSGYSGAGKDNVLSMNVSVPFSIFGIGSNGNYTQANFGASRSNSGRMQNQVSLSGTALDGNNLNYSLSTSQTSGGSGSHASSQQASARYRGSKGRVSLGYSQSEGSANRVNYGYSTTLLAHPYGLTIGQELSQMNSAAALVRAPGAKDVRVSSQQGVRTDSRGYAIVPNLQAYRYNNIQLDSSTLSDNAELGKTQVRKVPTQGAVVLAEYQTQIGNKAYVHLTHAGKNLPLGNEVKSQSGATGIVDDRGMAWITGLADNDTIYVKLGSKQCSAVFNVADFVLTGGILRGALNCI